MIAVERIRERLAEQPSAPVQVPPQRPVQLPPVADGIFNFVVAALAAGSQPVVNQEPVCGLAVSMASSVEPSTAQVGQPVEFTYTVTNPGTVSMTDVQVESALSGGVNFVSATSGGAVEPETGYVAWALSSGLAPGASTTLSVSVTISGPGEWQNDACSAGVDAARNEVVGCTSAMVLAIAPTSRQLTPTPTSTVAPTSTLAATPSVIPTGTPQVAPLPITPGPQPVPLPITPGPEPAPLPITPGPNDAAAGYTGTRTGAAPGNT